MDRHEGVYDELEDEVPFFADWLNQVGLQVRKLGSRSLGENVV